MIGRDYTKKNQSEWSEKDWQEYRQDEQQKQIQQIEQQRQLPEPPAPQVEAVGVLGMMQEYRPEEVSLPLSPQQTGREDYLPELQKMVQQGGLELNPVTQNEYTQPAVSPLPFATDIAGNTYTSQEDYLNRYRPIAEPTAEQNAVLDVIRQSQQQTQPQPVERPQMDWHERYLRDAINREKRKAMGSKGYQQDYSAVDAIAKELGGYYQQQQAQEAKAELAKEDAALRERLEMIKAGAKEQLTPYQEETLQMAKDKVAKAEAEAERKRQFSEQNISNMAKTVVEDTQRALDVLDKYGGFAAEWGSLSKEIPGSPALALQKHIDSVKSNIGIDKLLDIKREGSGLGQVPQSQLEMLASVLGNLDTRQNPEDLKYNLERAKEIYQDISDRVKSEKTKDGKEVGGFVIPEVSIPEGTVQRNKKTGQTRIMRGGQWQIQ